MCIGRSPYLHWQEPISHGQAASNAGHPVTPVGIEASAFKPSSRVIAHSAINDHSAMAGAPALAFLETLPLWADYVPLPAWGNPISSVSFTASEITRSRRLLMLRPWPGAERAYARFSGRVMVDRCWNCGDMGQVYPLSGRSSKRFRSALLSFAGSASYSMDELRALMSANRCGEMFGGGEPLDNSGAVVAWVCSKQHCGGSVGIADPRRNELLAEGSRRRRRIEAARADGPYSKRNKREMREYFRRLLREQPRRLSDGECERARAWLQDWRNALAMEGAYRAILRLTWELLRT